MSLSTHSSHPDSQPPRPGTKWLGTTADEAQPKKPWVVGIALALGIFLINGPFMGINAVLLPSRIAEISPEGKAGVVALLSSVAMIVATLANIIIGSLSDRTRSRWGRRTPWLIGGSIATAGTLLIVSQVQTVPMLIFVWCVLQLGLNSLIAPLIAVMSDRVAPKHRGTISSIYAVGFSGGVYGGQIIGAQFLGAPMTGFYVLSGLILLAGPVAALIMREPSSLDMPRMRLNKQELLHNFALPIRGARDYYFALFGKLFIVAAKYSISGYMLFILTDYMLIQTEDASGVISLVSLALMITAIGMGAIAGPISDRMGRRRPPVITAGILISLGSLIPFLSPQPWTLVAYGIVAGIGMGAFNSVDQALNIDVLPNADNAAKDLGILNLANTGGQVLGPIIAASAISTIGYHALFPAAAILAALGTFSIALIRSVR